MLDIYIKWDVSIWIWSMFGISSRYYARTTRLFTITFILATPGKLFRTLFCCLSFVILEAVKVLRKPGIKHSQFPKQVGELVRSFGFAGTICEVVKNNQQLNWTDYGSIAERYILVTKCTWTEGDCLTRETERERLTEVDRLAEVDAVNVVGRADARRCLAYSRRSALLLYPLPLLAVVLLGSTVLWRTWIWWWWWWWCWWLLFPGEGLSLLLGLSA